VKTQQSADDQLGLGEIIRRQRELAELSMRQVAAMAGISNPYLSQIEHGLRAPSGVLRAIAESSTFRAGPARGDEPAGGSVEVVEAVQSDPI
jgi:transcriptional regulator with XRE-family HTH domain